MKSIDFLNSDKSIAGVFANQRGMYYDMWTLRHKTICPVDVWEEILDYTIKNKVTDEMAYEYTLKKRKFNCATICKFLYFYYIKIKFPCNLIYY